MSAEDRALVLWKLVRLFESESRQRLIQRSGGEDQFIQEILLKKEDIQRCPTGQWMFKGGRLRDPDEMDVAELLVIIENTDVGENVEQDWKSCFNAVKKVRNFLAHKGQIFGVDENKYQQYLKDLKKFLNVLNVDPVDYLIQTKEEKKDLKDRPMKSLQITRERLNTEMKKAFNDFKNFNIGNYLSKLESNFIIDGNESAYINHERTPLDKNMVFYRCISSKDMEIIKRFVDLMIENNEAIAQRLEQYFWD